MLEKLVRRTLLRNKIPLWFVRPTGKTDSVDSDGNFTGETTVTYSAPVKIAMSVYPVTGDIEYAVNGHLEKYDLVATGSTVDLAEGDLLFKQVPISDYDVTNDYYVGEKFESLNVIRYGLKARV